MSFPNLSLGSSGESVERWQQVLITAGLDLGKSGADGQFGPTTRKQTEAFQSAHGLPVDGTVGQLEWDLVQTDDHDSVLFGPQSQAFPDGAAPAPPFKPLSSNAEREALFGHIAFKPYGSTSNPEAIVITNDWASQNIVTTYVPQLAKIPGVTTKINDKTMLVGKGPASGKVQCHRLVEYQLKMLWADIEAAGLLDHVITWDGLWSPRFIRGSRTTLSNHSYGTAFDINYRWNQLGAAPAESGSRGSVCELVYLFHRWGFYWGGHFSRRDGMHAEVARLIASPG